MLCHIIAHLTAAGVVQLALAIHSLMYGCKHCFLLSVCLQQQQGLLQLNPQGCLATAPFCCFLLCCASPTQLRMRHLLTLRQSSLELAHLLEAQSQGLQSKVSDVLDHFWRQRPLFGPLSKQLLHFRLSSGFALLCTIMHVTGKQQGVSP